MFDIDRPTAQGGMQWMGRAELTAAVAEAGELGFLTAMTQPDTDALRREMSAYADGVYLSVYFEDSPAGSTGSSICSR